MHIHLPRQHVIYGNLQPGRNQHQRLKNRVDTLISGNEAA
jgi:hypothetical protein